MKDNDAIAKKKQKYEVPDNIRLQTLRRPAPGDKGNMLRIEQRDRCRDIVGSHGIGKNVHYGERDRKAAEAGADIES